ncbi:hypothetical protein [Muriicola sp. Z0-33]|uniref:hypothetical protein n=1 Tax=Muriicola sp. Z0-33 TaxID=2816957 RepID=UPI00223900A3|nr:hypothetical protein [Muriicola sp. Z0-33]MCW5515235.1 hypothetical protein [Muriicola sp. Z0-33]
MNNKGRYTDMKTWLIKRLAFIIAVFYLLSPFQQQLSTVLHNLSHDLSLPDYVMTHASEFSEEGVYSHQYGQHRTSKIVHEHQIIDFVQSLLQNTSENNSQSDPLVPGKSIDKHLVAFKYTLENQSVLELENSILTPERNVLKGYSSLWQEPPIYILL